MALAHAENPKARGSQLPRQSCALMNRSSVCGWRPAGGRNALPGGPEPAAAQLQPPPGCPALGFLCAPRSTEQRPPRRVLFFCCCCCLLHREAEFMGLEVASPTERNTLLHSWEEYYWLL